MKAVAVAVTVLFLTVGLIGTDSILISRDVRRFSDVIEKTALVDAEEISRIYADFRKRERLFALTVNHTDLSNLEAAFAEWEGAALAGDPQNAMIIKCRLTDALEHLRRQVGFSADGIF